MSMLWKDFSNRLMVKACKPFKVTADSKLYIIEEKVVLGQFR